MAWTTWKSFASFTNIARTGGSNWNNPSNAGASDNSYATTNILTSTSTNFLAGTNADFSAEIPDGSTITGVKVRFERKQSNLIDGGISTAYIQLIKGGAVTGTEQTLSASWGGSDALSAEVGGSGNLLGASFTRAEVLATDTGVGLACRDDAGAGTVGSVDILEYAWEYTPPQTRRRVFSAAIG